MNFKAVFFDFDYTLADGTEAIVAGFRYAFGRMGLPEPTEEAIRPTIGMVLEDEFTFLSGEADPARRAEFRQLYTEKAGPMHVSVTRLFPGALELLTALKRRGIPTGIVSTKKTATIRDVAEARGITPPLSSTGHFMPKTSVIFYCIERFRVLLELSSLVFETEISTPAPHNSIDVRLGSTVYGRLLLPQEAILTADKRNSLERLAYALAIVSANAKLVEHLSQEQAALQTVFESMTDGVVIIGKSGLIRYANEYAGKLLNEGDSVLMLMFSDIMTSNWESITGNRITDDLQNKTKTRVRSRIGGNRVLELLPFTVSDMPGLAGERTGWILRDITQEVSLEAVKENIVGVVAHELKTPLTLLQLQVRDLTRTIEHGQMPSINDVRDLSDETIHLGQLVDDLLDVSRIRAGAMKLNVRVVHVASLIDRAEKLAAARYPMKVSRHIDMDAELFCVDPDRLTQVFVNLFNNAARYKKPTQEVALIDVSTRIDGQQIVIDITDQGIGIAPGKAKHIFDQFYQADMTASRSHSGSGLGLTIVRGIIHAHGGTIAVHFSNPEFGTRFTLRLPLSMPPELI